MRRAVISPLPRTDVPVRQCNCALCQLLIRAGRGARRRSPRSQYPCPSAWRHERSEADVWNAPMAARFHSDHDEYGVRGSAGPRARCSLPAIPSARWGSSRPDRGHGGTVPTLRIRTALGVYPARVNLPTGRCCVILNAPRYKKADGVEPSGIPKARLRAARDDDCSRPARTAGAGISFCPTRAL